ncbi:hypothetical protein FSB78_02775 [Sphingomonas ginsenosidivorax]|uniref:Glycosyltransferase RgtA/B/C/D-like domain-containing protein n=1 Tax=Sphingomonas ginsenosidivorax TaxID=862135 RepID=A0A5C6UAT1_9SPHN|nr:hypothetical protein [Sphingomonas ginsenosidivorax]TXC69997.1 hypothetical protein FSB78_02775 [Sphingomonas ginsenosidivorax]
MTRLSPRWRYGIAAVLLFVLSLAAAWPGVAMYDTVAQYRQVLSSRYDDWHPPVMARLWAMFAPIGPGAAPMLVVQLATYWAGLGLIAAALGEVRARRRAIALLCIGALPPFLGWQIVVLKDAQLVGAVLAATGLVAWWRLRDRRIPPVAIAAIVLLLGYALLVRANAVFLVVPLAVMMIAVRPVMRVAIGLVAVLAVLVVSPLINHRMLGAAPSGVERTQALYDLAGIAARVPDRAHIGLTAAEARAVIARHCATPFFWDPLGDDAHCGAVMARLRAEPVGRLYAMLADAVLHHPIAYARQRLAHWNSTERWLVPVHWPNAAPPAEPEPNTLALGRVGAAVRGWQAMAGMVVETPLGWPIAWLVVAATALAVAARRVRAPSRDLATALLVSGIALEASFAVLSIASDLRYHLWPMVATAVAVTLLADGQAWPRGIVRAGVVTLVVVLGGGLAARLTLPLPPATYQGMLG